MSRPAAGVRREPAHRNSFTITRQAAGRTDNTTVTLGKASISSFDMTKL